jgi:U4/U6.U5 tri-snRNP-associated protein 1
VIGNDINDISEGVDYVFTLKDKNVLQDDENFELDEIENVLTKNNFKKKENKFFDNFGNKKSILSQYDEEKESSFVIINQQEDKVEEDNKKGQLEELNNVRQKLKLMKEKNFNYDQNNPSHNHSSIELNMNKKFISDYMTQEEGKLQTFKKKKISKKSIKSVQTLDQDEKEQFENSNSYNNKNYDEYDDLNIYLEKQRNIINKEKKQLESIIKIPKENNNNNNIHEEQNQIEFISETTEFLKNVPTKKDVEENEKLILSSTPFVSLKDIKSGTASVVNIALPTERLKFGVSSVYSQDSNITDKEFLNKKRKPSTDLNMKTDSDQNLEQDHEVLLNNDLLSEEPLVGKGIATALQVLRKRGLIGKKTMWGRYKDKTHTTNDNLLKNQDIIDKNVDKKYDFNIDLDYRDSQGKILTPKEMYRQQSYIFHGKGPSKKKIEKRLLREQLEEKMKNIDPSQASKTFHYLKKIQKKSNTPYVVLQGKNSTLPQI